MKRPAPVANLRRMLGFFGWGMGFFALVGCSDRPPPVPELPGIEFPREPTRISLTIPVTFSRNEQPEQVFRSVDLVLEDPGLPPELRLLGAALSHLVLGPTLVERSDGLESFFSESTADVARVLSLRGDTVIVDLSDLSARIPNASTSAGSRQLLNELNGTVFGLAGFSAVEYRMEGSCERFWNWLGRSCGLELRPLQHLTDSTLSND